MYFYCLCRLLQEYSFSFSVVVAVFFSPVSVKEVVVVALVEVVAMVEVVDLAELVAMMEVAMAGVMVEVVLAYHETSKMHFFFH